MKPIIFTGDSFTFGEGLELYNEEYRNFVYRKYLKNKEWASKGNKLEWDDNGYFWHKFQNVAENIIPAGSLRYEYSYPALVSKYFNTLAFRKHWNGGNNSLAATFALECLKRYGKDEFSIVIINLTTLNRDDYIILEKYFLSTYSIKIDRNYLPKLYKLFLDWDSHCEKAYNKIGLSFTEDVKIFEEISNGFIDIELALKLQNDFGGYESLNVKIQTLVYKEYIYLYKKLDIPYYFISHWSKYETESLNKIEDEDVKKYIKDKMIPIHYNNEIKNLSDNWDIPFYINEEFPWTNNQHPSKKGHEIIADSIIKFIENNNLK